MDGRTDDATTTTTTNLHLFCVASSSLVPASVLRPTNLLIMVVSVPRPHSVRLASVVFSCFMAPAAIQVLISRLSRLASLTHSLTPLSRSCVSTPLYDGEAQFFFLETKSFSIHA